MQALTSSFSVKPVACLVVACLPVAYLVVACLVAACLVVAYSLLVRVDCSFLPDFFVPDSFSFVLKVRDWLWEIFYDSLHTWLSLLCSSALWFVCI